MFLTNSSGYYQPYISGKSGKGTYAQKATWSRPRPTDDPSVFGNRTAFAANPIRHWRKQLAPYNNSGTTGNQIPFDRPGSSVYLGVTADCKGNSEILNIPDNKDTLINQGLLVETVGPNNSRICSTCENNTQKRRATSAGQNTVPINPPNPQEEPTRQYCFSNREYLRKKCRTYKQNISGAPITFENIDYSGPYNDDEFGPQTLQNLNCIHPGCDGDPPTSIVIKKPNNRQYGVQGAVDSSSRIQRLKMNTINRAANNLRQEYGSAGANAAKYTANGATPYFIKSKVNSFPKNTAHHRDGNKTICNCD